MLFAVDVNDRVKVALSAVGKAWPTVTDGIGVSVVEAGWALTLSETAGAAITVRLSTEAVARPWLELSCTLTVSEVVPAVVGVPERTPVGLRVRPATVPEANDHVKGKVPPVTVNVCE